MVTRISPATSALIVTATLLGFVGAAYGVDGVILIDQNRALTGNVTPGDTPGFPVTISQPGSYRLSGNLTVPNENTHGIEITASEVTIDLNGFSIRGPVTCSGAIVTACSLGGGTGEGILSSPTSNNVNVHSGTFRGMGNNGIALQGFGNVVENVRAEQNGRHGIFIGGGLASHNTTTRNGSDGIAVNRGTVNHSHSSGNRDNGISLVVGTVHHNTAEQNGAAGLNLQPTAGYVSNVMFGNTTPVSGGGVSLGGGNHNLCNGVAC